MKGKFDIAYFSAEIGISRSLPTYSGGLGVLAGDHIKSAADLGLNMCGITLLYKEGYFKQRIDEEGIQTENYPKFDPYPFLDKLDASFTLKLRERDVFINVYEYEYEGVKGEKIPIFFLDTDCDKNFQDDRIITLRLYSGDKDHRILQEAILGFGGMKMLRMMNQDSIKTFHMNEGHCSFLVLDLLEKNNGDIEKVKSLCHFTTHTPVPAGHDHFSYDRVKKLIRGLLPEKLKLPSLVQDDVFHMTELGLYFSRSSNGVSRLHEKVAQDQFKWKKIKHITNGVHHIYWMAGSFKDFYDVHLHGWRSNPELLLQVDQIPSPLIYAVHNENKKKLIAYANSQSSKALDPEVLTIGFARRAATYKRAHLIFHDMEKLLDIGQGNLQIIFSGKAHPKDMGGKSIIRNIVQSAKRFDGKIKIIYLENYDMWLGRLITSGVDLWLNTPQRPNEASGTSGMKAALNGIPNFSILDGWWAEGCKEGKNGWAIGSQEVGSDEKDARDLYNKLKNEIITTFYDDRDGWVTMMKESIKTSVQFTSQRMVYQYNEMYYKG